MAPKSKQQKIRDFIDEVSKNIKEDLEADQHNRTAAIDDLKFSNPGDPQQWNQGNVQDRKNDGRPYLTINLFPEKMQQVVGDIRHNRPRAKISPADADADTSIAKIREGIISDSEYQSNSDYIYVEAGATMATCGYGAWEIKTQYCEDNPFVQEMRDELIPDPFVVIMDCHAKDPIYADAQRGCKVTVLPKRKFEAEYPDTEFPVTSTFEISGMPKSFWVKKEHVTVLEYYEIRKEEKTVCLMKDGTVLEKTDAEELISKWQKKFGIIEELPVTPAVMPTSAPPPALPVQPVAPGATPPAPAPQAAPGKPPVPSPGAALPASPAGPPMPQMGGQPPMMGQAPGQPPMRPLPPLPPKPEIVKERTTKKSKVKKWILTATDILSKNGLDGEDVPGEYIPLVLITGNRVCIEGKTYISGIVRNGKDPARNVNYWWTAGAERVALEPKAPYMATAKQIEGYEDLYATANIKNPAVMLYVPDQTDSGQPLPPPIRQQAANVPSALFATLNTALQLFDSSTGMHKADTGADEGQGRTGQAVLQRQKPGDIGTFCYINNLARGIAHGARIKNSMIAELYDTDRDVRVVDTVNDIESYVPINTSAKEAYDRIQANPKKYQGMNTTRLIAAIQRFGPDAKYNDISSGKYSVKVEVGPSYATQRQESADAMLRIAQYFPKIMEIGGDKVIRNLGIKDSDDIADRLRKIIPQGLLKLRPGEQPYQPPVPPQIRLMMAKEQTEQLKQQTQKMAFQVKLAELYKATKETDTEIRKEILNIMEQLHAPAGSNPVDALALPGPGDQQ